MSYISDKENREIDLCQYLTPEERSKFLGEERKFGGYEPSGEMISTSQISHSITIGQLASLLDNYLNLGGKSWREGLELGRLFLTTHPTIQQLFVSFLMGALMGMAEKEDRYTDARNTASAEMLRKLKKLVDDGELAMAFPYI